MAQPKRTSRNREGVKGSMFKRCRQRKGQAILEYLVIATVIVLAIVAIRGTVETRVGEVFTASADRTGDAATALGDLQLEVQ